MHEGYNNFFTVKVCEQQTAKHNCLTICTRHLTGKPPSVSSIDILDDLSGDCARMGSLVRESAGLSAPILPDSSFGRSGLGGVTKPSRGRNFWEKLDRGMISATSLDWKERERWLLICKLKEKADTAPHTLQSNAIIFYALPVDHSLWCGTGHYIYPT